jgi:hypothetical protein
MTKELVSCLLLVAAGACSKSDTLKPPVKMSAEAQDRSVALHEKMAAVAEKDGSDCAKLAADLHATIVAAQVSVLGSANVVAEMGHDAGDPLPDIAPELGSLDAAHAARVTAANEKMQPSLRACAQDPNLRVALMLLSQ